MPRPHRCDEGAAEVRRTPAGGSTAELPLLVGHSSLSGPPGQRLVSVIQYTIAELFELS
jgi:hypothetical protein